MNYKVISAPPSPWMLHLVLTQHLMTKTITIIIPLMASC